MNLEDKDIQKLFQDKLGKHEMPVNPELWAGVQAGIGASATGGAAAAGFGVMKFIIGAAVIAGIATGTYLIWPENSNSEAEPVVQTEETIAPKQKDQEVTEEIVIPVQQEVEEQVHIAQKEENTAGIDEELPQDQEESTAVPDEAEDLTELPSSEPVKTEPSNDPVAATQTDDNIESSDDVAQEEPFESPEYSFEVNVDKADPMSISYQLGTSKTNAVWRFGDGDTSTSAKGMHEFTEEGDYTVKVESIDEAGNVTVFEEEVRIYHDPVLVLSNVFSPGITPGANDFYDIDKSSSKYISTYVIRIYSGDGKDLIFESDENNPVWDGNDKFGNPMPQGNYLAIVTASNTLGSTVTKSERIILER